MRRFNFNVRTRYGREDVSLVVSMPICVGANGGEIRLGVGGYKSWWGNTCREGADSPLRGQKYQILRQMFPQEGDVWTYKSRTFVVGKREGFVSYRHDLLENGKKVAAVYYSDYYCD